MRVAREELTQIGALTRQITALEHELGALVKAYRPELLADTGCGALTAAILIGRTAGAERFKPDAHFARHAGVAPIACSSGQTVRHRLHRGGDRQLNHALHIIAVTRARRDPATKLHLERKLAEGKTRREALRCLQRHLARRFPHLLTAPPAARQPHLPVAATAPSPMVCLTSEQPFHAYEQPSSPQNDSLTDTRTPRATASRACHRRRRRARCIA
ncbi:MAG: transposase [Actinobacteria bacterium]|nr:transposase [Actinomycetota bacterium]